MEFSKELTDEIWDYCRLNKITNMDEFMEKLLKQGFTIEKFGSAPAGFGEEPKTIEKIVEKEVIKEVPKIVIQEVVKEVVKEVPVEKEVYITDDTKTNELLTKISDLERLLNENEAKYTELKESHTLELKQAEEVKNDLISEMDRLKSEYSDKINSLNQELSNKTKTRPNIYDDDNGSFGSNLLDR